MSEGDQIIPVVNALVPVFRQRVLVRDWHPPNHVSFSDPPEFRDGSWPPHCVQGTVGAEFHPALVLPEDAVLISKGTDPEREAYSSFQGDIDLAAWLRDRGVKRIFLTGLATDYCVKSTALDARRKGFEAVLIEDAVRGVAPETSARALEEMEKAGVVAIQSRELLGQPMETTW